jgi:hypothetical protein
MARAESGSSGTFWTAVAAIAGVASVIVAVVALNHSDGSKPSPSDSVSSESPASNDTPSTNGSNAVIAHVAAQVRPTCHPLDVSRISCLDGATQVLFGTKTVADAVESDASPGDCTTDPGSQTIADDVPAGAHTVTLYCWNSAQGPQIAWLIDGTPPVALIGCASCSYDDLYREWMLVRDALQP